MRQQIFLEDEHFVARMMALVDPALRGAAEVPKTQRRTPASLMSLMRDGLPRDEALVQAHRSGTTMTALARELGLSVSRVSRIIAQAEAGSTSDPKQRAASRKSS